MCMYLSRRAANRAHQEHSWPRGYICAPRHGGNTSRPRAQSRLLPPSTSLPPPPSHARFLSLGRSTDRRVHARVHVRTRSCPRPVAIAVDPILQQLHRVHSVHLRDGAGGGGRLGASASSEGARVRARATVTRRTAVGSAALVAPATPPPLEAALLSATGSAVLTLLVLACRVGQGWGEREGRARVWGAPTVTVSVGAGAIGWLACERMPQVKLPSALLSAATAANASATSGSRLSVPGLGCNRHAVGVWTARAATRAEARAGHGQGRGQGCRAAQRHAADRARPCAR